MALTERQPNVTDSVQRERNASVEVPSARREILALDLGGRFVMASNGISYLIPSRTRDLLQPVDTTKFDVTKPNVLEALNESLEQTHIGYVEHRRRQWGSVDMADHLRIASTYGLGSLISAVCMNFPKRLQHVTGHNILVPDNSGLAVVTYSIESGELPTLENPLRSDFRLIDEFNDSEQYYYAPTLSVVFVD